MMKIKQYGITLIELMISLAVVSIVISGVVIMAEKVMLKTKVNGTVSDIALMVTEIRAAYSDAKNYSGISATVMVGMGSVPSKLITGNIIYSRFGPTFIFTAINSNTDFGIAINGKIPSSACSELISKIWNVAKRILVPGVVVLKSSQSTALNMASVSTACANGNANGIIWEFD